jgi:hypothetical protein
MNRLRRLRGNAVALAILAFAGLFVPPAHAQRNPNGAPQPKLYAVFPPGGKVGTTVDVTVAGRDLDEPEKLVFSNPGIKAELVPAPKPEIDPKTKKPKPVMGALPAGLFKFKVTIAAGTPLGNHDVRLIGKWGGSNPRTFVVGDLAEVLEKEPNNDTDQAQRVELNATINGTLGSPTDVDYYVVKVAKGQRVLVSCLASSIDSRALPGIEVYNSKDIQVASNNNYHGSDALADFTAKEEGDYSVRVFQFTHTFRQPITGGMPAGSSDHAYRLSITTKPWIDSVFPSVIEPGKTVNVTVYGRNLPGGKLDPTAVADDVVLEKATLSITAPAEGQGKLAFSGLVSPPMGFLDGFEVRVKNDSGASNPFLISLAQAPVVLDNGDNDTPETAQEVTLPCEIAGRIEKRRDRDWYTFSAKKGETWNIEVLSNRLGAPTYMMFALRNPTTKGEMYETPLTDNNMQRYARHFFAHSEDPSTYRFTAPADGKYQLLIASRAGDSLYGARHYYQVRITRDEADFHLVATGASTTQPEAVTVSGGGYGAFTILAERRPGFTGDIELSVEGLPPGVSCPPQTLAGSIGRTTLVLSGAADVASWSGEVKIKGTATIDGKKVVREARGASIIWPVQPNSNTVTISRVDRSAFLSVHGKAPFTLIPTLDKNEVTQGDKAVLKVKVDRLLADLKGPLQIQVMQGPQQQGAELPVNLRINNNQPINVNAGQKEGTLNVTVGADVPPGVYNVVLRGQTQGQYQRDPKNKQKQNIFFVQPSAPVSITVLPKSLATFTVANPSPTVKLGKEVEVVVRVARKFNYTGPFTVQLVVPPGVKGIEAEDVTIPAGKDEAKLVVRVPADAAVGNRGNLVVKATTTFGKTPVVHESKFSVNVVK